MIQQGIDLNILRFGNVSNKMHNVEEFQACVQNFAMTLRKEVTLEIVDF
jgi:hypothetical protein